MDKGIKIWLTYKCESKKKKECNQYQKCDQSIKNMINYEEYD